MKAGEEGVTQEENGEGKRGADKQADRQTDKLTDKQTDRQGK